MSAVSWTLLALYFACLAGLAVYGLHRLALVWIRLRVPEPAPAGTIGPQLVTVQLPVFNEIYVLDRLLEAVCALRYPRDLLEIQILDDSTDSTAERARELEAQWRQRGFDVACLHRARRDGFKSGALAEGLERARGSFIAIFDADFVPAPDFLERTLPWFADPRVGMVQARWGHLNRGYSCLTRAQALLLDGHFRVEQAARSGSDRFFNFNGTAGIFRRECIERSGGWQSDTLTEDLDLSYRAQMAGWRFVYLDRLVCPAELPVEMNALRSQQHRWTMGSMQTARKILPSLLRSRLPWRVKTEAFLHLTNNAAYPLLFLASVLLIPSLAARRDLGWSFSVPDLLVFFAGTGSFALFCVASQRGRGRGWIRAAAEVPFVMALGAGLALNNALAVAEALAGSRTEFRRTPKFRLEDRRAGAAACPAPERACWQALAYRAAATRLPIVETLLCAVFTAGAAWAWEEGLYPSLPFLALFTCGYAYVAGLSFAQGLGARILPRRRTERRSTGGAAERI